MYCADEMLMSLRAMNGNANTITLWVFHWHLVHMTVCTCSLEPFQDLIPNQGFQLDGQSYYSKASFAQFLVTRKNLCFLKTVVHEVGNPPKNLCKILVKSTKNLDPIQTRKGPQSLRPRISRPCCT